MPVLVKMLESISNSGKRGANTSHAAASTSFCKNTLGGSDVASETRAAFVTGAALDIACCSWVMLISRRTFAPRQYFEGSEKCSPQGSLKIEVRAAVTACLGAGYLIRGERRAPFGAIFRAWL